jgi:hypothetical protein
VKNFYKDPVFDYYFVTENKKGGAKCTNEKSF